MKNPVIPILILLVLMLSATTSVAGGEWQIVSDRDGTALFVRDLQGHSEAQFKGVCVVDRSIEDVGAVLSDIASYPKWFFKCIEAKKVPIENSSEHHFFLYVAIDTPWPFADRDVVYETRVRIDHAAGKVVIRSSALKKTIRPSRRRYVRITDSEHEWILERISADRTRIIFINRTNVAGPFANYISNPGIRETTVCSLTNLKKILEHTGDIEK
jgi:hypothetical protein